MKKYSLAFSPCPNDTFMFAALTNGLIDTEGLEFEFIMEDVEQLNRLAMESKTDFTKMSISAFAMASRTYCMLNSGAAFGNGYGPLLVSKRPLSADELHIRRVVIPGKYTTANLLLSVFYPGVKNKTELVFSEIEQALLDERADAGVIIHENRFTYEARGLKKIADLGVLWQQRTGQPVPLGCIAARRSHEQEVIRKTDSLLHRSILFAMKNPQAVMGYVKQHAQEMDEAVMLRHIAFYVNEYSLALNAQGQGAVKRLLDEGFRAGLLPQAEKNIFAA